MRRSARNAVGVAATMALIALAISAFAASSASAAFGVKKWEAGTCTVGTCTFAGKPEEFFAQAAGHPPAGVTDFSFNTGLLGVPEGAVKNVRVDLPQGLNVNPQAVPQCPVESFVASESNCSASAVGV